MSYDVEQRAGSSLLMRAINRSLLKLWCNIIAKSIVICINMSAPSILMQAIESALFKIVCNVIVESVVRVVE